jgi:hypothetical protein
MSRYQVRRVVIVSTAHNPMIITPNRSIATIRSALVGPRATR